MRAGAKRRKPKRRKPRKLTIQQRIDRAVKAAIERERARVAKLKRKRSLAAMLGAKRRAVKQALTPLIPDGNRRTRLEIERRHLLWAQRRKRAIADLGHTEFAKIVRQLSEDLSAPDWFAKLY